MKKNVDRAINFYIIGNLIIDGNTIAVSSFNTKYITYL